MNSPPNTQPSLFTRERTMHRFTARRVRVTHTAGLGQFVRVSLAGAELHDWASTGPGDHAKVFFPDPVTGTLNAPTPLGPTEVGIVRPEGPSFGRDFTPLNIRTDTHSGLRAFDIDVLRHADAGPAARWAESAKVGDELVVVGPRGSVEAARNARRVICVVDESALPAASRWLTEMPRTADIEIIADVRPTAELAWIRSYLSTQGGRAVAVHAVSADTDGLIDALRALNAGPDTYVFAAGEATRLIPLRRHLKATLPREQFVVQGYWKRGDSAFDHHAPIDPDDPDEV